MWERRRRKRGEQNQCLTKENIYTCVRAGKASVNYVSAGFWISHRDCYSALSTVPSLHVLYFLFFHVAPSVFVLYLSLVQITVIAPKSHHCLEAVQSVHLVILSLIISFLPLLFSFHSPLIACCLSSFLILSAVSEKARQYSLHMCS